MAIDQQTATRSERAMTLEEEIGQLDELSVDAPEGGKAGFERVLQELTSKASRTRVQLGPSAVLPGNFPQAFSHLAVVSAAFSLDRKPG